MDILKGLFTEFGWFIKLLVGVGILWFFTGGYMSETAREGPYLKPPAPLDTGEAYGGRYATPTLTRKETLDLPQSPSIVIRGIEDTIKDFFAQSKEASKLHESSILSKIVYLDGEAGAKATNPQKEYVRLIASPSVKGTVDLTGLTLSGGGYGVTARIPQAASLPVLGSPYKKSDVSMPANGRAIVSSGRSPIGTSFRVNMCSGYLGQFQSYVPELRQECPEPIVELESAGLGGDVSCRAFVEKLPTCRVYNGSFPADLSASCRAFVTDGLTYNSCVARNSSEDGFYKNEWRVFLEQQDELWKEKREIVRLLDKTGSAIDAITY